VSTLLQQAAPYLLCSLLASSILDVQDAMCYTRLQMVSEPLPKRSTGPAKIRESCSVDHRAAVHSCKECQQLLSPKDQVPASSQTVRRYGTTQHGGHKPAPVEPKGVLKGSRAMQSFEDGPRATARCQQPWQVPPKHLKLLTTAAVPWRWWHATAWWTCTDAIQKLQTHAIYTIHRIVQGTMLLQRTTKVL
jgi:hypothetical protein